MAKAKSRSTFSWSAELGRTIRALAYCGLAYGGIHRVTWMIVELNSKPPWLEFGLAVLAVLGTGGVFGGWKLIATFRRVKAARENQPPPLSLPAPDQGDE